MGGEPERPGNGLVDWRIWQQQFMPLSVAAAIAFRQAQRGASAIHSASDYIEALDAAAGALSWLIPIYRMDDAMRTRVAIAVDLRHGKFARGASEYRRSDDPVFAPLSVVRGDLTSALSFMRQVGPALAFGPKSPLPDG